MDIPQEFLDAVVFLEIEEGDDYKKIGTAFVIEESEGDRRFAYVVTCRHVIHKAIKENKQLFVRANLLEEKGIEHIPIENRWVFYDDKSEIDLVDLAVYPWKPVSGVKPTTVATINSNMIYVQEGMRRIWNRDLQAGDDIFFIGVFEQIDFHYRIHPLVRFGKISLIPEEEITGVKDWLGISDYYLVECQAYPSMSGSPVFIMKEKSEIEKYGLLGVMAGYFHEDEELDRKFTHYGISQVVPINKLGDIIWGEELKADRENKLREAKM